MKKRKGETAMSAPIYEPKDLTDILDFVLNESSDTTNPPAILKDHPYFLRIRELLEFARGYDFNKGPSLTVLADRFTGLDDRIIAVETITTRGGTLDTRIAAIENRIVQPPPEATQQPEDKANTTRANKHRR